MVFYYRNAAAMLPPSIVNTSPVVFFALAKAKKTTGDVLTIDGGNIAAALR